MARCCSRSTASSASEGQTRPRKSWFPPRGSPTSRDGFARTWRRPPSEQELQDLIEDYIRDEVFYREGRAAGLDRDDVVIRRRVRQKMEFLAEDMSVPEPNDEQLAAYLAANPERFRAEDHLTFRHVFLSRYAAPEYHRQR